jgi:hypothetical protein
VLPTNGETVVTRTNLRSLGKGAWVAVFSECLLKGYAGHQSAFVALLNGCREDRGHYVTSIEFHGFCLQGSMKVSIQHSRPIKDYIPFLLIHPAMGEAILRTRVTPKCCKLKSCTCCKEESVIYMTAADEKNLELIQRLSLVLFGDSQDSRFWDCELL